MKDEKITVEDYECVAPEFFAKYHYVAKELGEGAKAEEILKVMEALGSAVLKERVKAKVGPFGFNKQNNDTIKPDEC